MADAVTFDSVRTLVEGSYPMPVASVFNRYRMIRKEDLGGRHKTLVDLFEAFAKFICILKLQGARHALPNLKEKLPQRDKTLEFLKRPSLGGWVGLLRTLCDLKPEAAQIQWMQKIADWYREPKSEENTAALGLLKTLGCVPYEKRTKTPNAEILNALVTYRNKQLGHAANLAEAELERRIPLLENLLAHLLRSAAFLQETTTFFVDRVEIAEDNEKWCIHADQLVGTGREPKEYRTAKRLERKEIYVTDSGDGEIENPPIPLTPFLIWQTNDDLKRSEIYFYNDSRRTHLEYLSYMSGTFYFHKELHTALKDLIGLKLKPGLEEEELRALSPEERMACAEDLFKQAMLFSGKKQYEVALAALERAVEFERRPETFVAMAKIQHTLKDPPEGIQLTLQGCLDIDPNNEEALALRARLEAAEEEGPGPPEPEEGEEEMKFPSAFHVMTPHRWREYTLLWWLALLGGWYSFSAGAEWIAGYTENLLPNLLQFGVTFLVVIAVITLRSIVLRQRLPLSLQLDVMRLERFEAWFDDQLRFMFGNYVYRDGRPLLLPSIKRERLYYLGGLGFVGSVGLAAFLLSSSWKVPFPLPLLRAVDYALIYFIVYIGLRFVFASTLFVYRFSGLSLKPMLTRLNDDGLRSFGPLITMEIGFLSVLYVIYWILAAQVVHLSTYVDFFFVGLASVFFLVWSVGMPLMIRRAARESKSKSVHDYSAHIEKAFREFLKDPDNDKLERYEWLAKHQSLIRKISTWPLSLTETLLATVGGNVLLLAVNVWYILVRLDRWPEFTAYLRNWF